MRRIISALRGGAKGRGRRGPEQIGAGGCAAGPRSPAVSVVPPGRAQAASPPRSVRPANRGAGCTAGRARPACPDLSNRVGERLSGRRFSVPGSTDNVEFLTSGPRPDTARTKFRVGPIRLNEKGEKSYFPFHLSIEFPNFNTDSVPCRRLSRKSTPFR